jgi:hypothetical protein
MLARPTISPEVSQWTVAPRRLIFLAWMAWAFIGAGVGEKYLNLPLPVLWVGLYGPVVFLFAIWIRDDIVRPNVRLRKLTWLAIMLFAIYLCSGALLNETSLFGFAISARDYFKYIILFFPMASLFADEGTARRFFRLAVWLLVVQTPLVIYQFIVESGMAPDDTNGGTLGLHGSGQLMMLVAYAICVAISLWRFGYRRWYCVAASAWLVPIVPLAGAFAGVFFVPFAAVAGAIGMGLQRWLWRLVAYGLLAGLSIGGFVFAGGVDWVSRSTNYWGEGLRSGLSRVTAEVADSLGSPGRLYELNQIWQDAHASGRLWLGHGIGNDVGDFIDRLANRQNAQPLLFNLSISRALYEIGLVGISLYLFILAAMGHEVYCRRRAFQGAFWRGLYGAYFGCLALHVAGAFYQQNWLNTWASLPIWFLSALLIGHRSAGIVDKELDKDTVSCASRSPS